MPIELPPPPEPQQGSLEMRADARSFPVGGLTMQVSAPGILGEDDIARVLGQESDPSKAILALADAARRAGVIAPRTLYARSGDQIYVSISAGRIAEIGAPPRLMPYFEGLAGKAALRDRDLEPARARASIHADRDGEAYESTLLPLAGEDYRLELSPTRPRPDAGEVTVAFSNAGNRFTGREFVDLDASAGNRWGDRFRVVSRAKVDVFGFDEDRGDDGQYHEHNLLWDRVTPWGLFGAGGRYLEYKQTFDGERFRGEIWSVEANWMNVLGSGFGWRWTGEGRLDFIHDLIEGDAGSLRKEIYPSLEISQAYTRRLEIGSENSLVAAGIKLRKGLRDEETAVGSDLGYWLVRPELGGTLDFAPLSFSLEALGQYGSNKVPDQQLWVLGGEQNLRAWLPGVALGDTGSFAKAEVRYTSMELPLLKTVIKVAGFAEYGSSSEGLQFEESDGLFGQPSQGIGSADLADAGVEVSATVLKHLEASLSRAWPIYDHGVEQDQLDLSRADFYFKLSASF